MIQVFRGAIQVFRGAIQVFRGATQVFRGATQALRGALVAYVRRRPVGWRWTLAVLWAGFIWYLSSRPTGGGRPGILVIVLYNSAHVFLFGVLAALVHLAGSAREPVAFVRAVSLALLWGGLDELHQSFVPGRHSSAWDVGSDLAGAVLFASMVAALRGDRVRWARIAAPIAAIAALITVSAASFG